MSASVVPDASHTPVPVLLADIAREDEASSAYGVLEFDHGTQVASCVFFGLASRDAADRVTDLFNRVQQTVTGRKRPLTSFVSFRQPPSVFTIATGRGSGHYGLARSFQLAQNERVLSNFQLDFYDAYQAHMARKKATRRQYAGDARLYARLLPFLRGDRGYGSRYQTHKDDLASVIRLADATAPVPAMGSSEEAACHAVLAPPVGRKRPFADVEAAEAAMEQSPKRARAASDGADASVSDH